MAISTATTDRAAPARDVPGRGSAPFTLWPLFAVGCVLLVIAVLIMDNLPGWASDHGQLQILLPYFLLVSLAGRWFWKGIDAALPVLRKWGTR